MSHNFPWIETLADVEAAYDSDLFIKADRGDHIILNYILSSPATFPGLTGDAVADKEARIRREFRGIIFDKNGKIIRRPYHKFFNLNERPTEEFDLLECSALEKLDGSMIVPYKVSNRIIWGTKMGDTDIALQVADFVKNRPEYVKMFEYLYGMGFCPIFEWCSRKNKVVVDYPTDMLILTAVRALYSGCYMKYGAIKAEAANFGIPVVASYDTKDDIVNYIDEVKTMPYANKEGIVFRTKCGNMVKVKNDDYITRHKAKDSILVERNVAALILEDKIDDILPLLDLDTRNNVFNYATVLEENINKLVAETVMTFHKAITGERKDFAVNYNGNKVVKRYCFIFWEEHTQQIAYSVRQTIFKDMLDRTSSTSRYNEFKEIAFGDYAPLVYNIGVSDGDD